MCYLGTPCTWNFGRFCQQIFLTFGYESLCKWKIFGMTKASFCFQCSSYYIAFWHLINLSTFSFLSCSITMDEFFKKCPIMKATCNYGCLCQPIFLTFGYERLCKLKTFGMTKTSFWFQCSSYYIAIWQVINLLMFSFLSCSITTDEFFKNCHKMKATCNYEGLCQSIFLTFGNTRLWKLKKLEWKKLGFAFNAALIILLVGMW